MKYSELIQNIKNLLPDLREGIMYGMKSFFINNCQWPLIRIYQVKNDKFYVDVVHELRFGKTKDFHQLKKCIRIFDEHGREIPYDGGQYKSYRINQNWQILNALDQLKKNILLLPMKKKIQDLEKDFEEDEPSGI